MFIPILVLGLGVTAYFVQKEFRQLAEQQILENAHLMMETAKASRNYTTEQIEPLLTHEETRVAEGVKTLNDVINQQFPSALQQAVSGLSNAKDRQTLQILSEQIVQTFSNLVVSRNPNSCAIDSVLRRDGSLQLFPETYPDYSYKEATLNPTNPRDRTLEWEADLVNIFNKNPGKAELVGYRDTPEGPALYYCAPIRVDDKSCLACHGSAEDAPRNDEGLWKRQRLWLETHAIIGAQIVSVPARLVNESADAALRRVLTWLAGGYALIFVVVNFGVYFLARER